MFDPLFLIGYIFIAALLFLPLVSPVARAKRILRKNNYCTHHLIERQEKKVYVRDTPRWIFVCVECEKEPKEDLKKAINFLKERYKNEKT